MYDGEPILEYHSNYFEFLRHCTKDPKDYFIFCGVRNPMDNAASLYMKLMTDQNKAYSERKWLLDKGGEVSKRRVELYQHLKNVDNSFAVFLQNGKWIFLYT